jgi:hypothetical protein
MGQRITGLLRGSEVEYPRVAVLEEWEELLWGSIGILRRLPMKIGLE